MKSILTIFAVIFVLAPPVRAAVNDAFLVKDGQTQAVIVTADTPPRTTRLAAQELQLYVEKISGAQLPILTESQTRDAGDNPPVKVFVGRSSSTDALNLAVEGLRHGAYRIAAGENWLALLGDDTNFTPIEPWPRSNDDWVSGRVHEQWHKITNSTWGNPLSQMRKHYTGSTGSYGTPNHQATAADGTVHVWGFDERGSFNAVCGFLRSLGVRWYLPGELGEVVPELKTIALPRTERNAARATPLLYDEIVQPDFAVRAFNIRFGVHGHDTSRWAMRLGVRNPFGLQTAHGLHTMTHNEETLQAHPDWFALYGGKRHNQPGQRLNQLCYSNEELLRETVRFVQAQFDHYDFDVVSVMPPDGYTAICQCSLCEGKDAPQRGYRGIFSDYVWQFVNRVAKEVRKTHPDKMISNCAYGTYSLPPDSLEKLEPNVQVIIVGGRRPTNDQPEQRKEIRELQQAWLAKTDNPIMIFENYPFTDRGFYLPAYVPRVLGESINATKGISRGEDIWLSVRQDFDKVAVGFNHFLVYFTARMYWGGPQQDVVAMFDEYCHLFYGPAAEPMQAFFRFCEEHWREMEKEKATADRALELFAAAQAAAPPGSIYSRRIALIDNYLEGLRNKSRQLGQRRGPVPQVRLVRDSAQIVVDGKLDEEAWQQCPVSSTGRLRELQTGRQPIFGTSFKTAWSGGNLYFAIRCEERPGEKLNIATTRPEDQAIWYGDVIEIELATEMHSYYQIAVNPAGALIDLDRAAPKSQWFDWDSKAEVATQVADDHWTVEIRIPVVQDENDPLHQVIGHKPTQSLPWHINICRQRIRENGTELSAFSPTGQANFHVPMKFAHFYAGRSHRFDADESVSDYLIAQQAAFEQMRQRKFAEALSAFVKLAGGKVTDLQKSAALEQAAVCARALQDFAQAEKLTDQIPIDAVAKVVRMQNLLAERKSSALLAEFRDEDISQWPFWKTGEAWYLRGRAFAAEGDGARAEADLLDSLRWTSDSRTRLDVLLALATNREDQLNDKAAALEAYTTIADAVQNNGSATYFRGVLGAAQLLRADGKHDAALATLRRVDAGSLRGYWHGALLVALGDTLAAAGRTDEAKKAYREVLADDGVTDADRKAAQLAIEKLKE